MQFYKFNKIQIGVLLILVLLIFVGLSKLTSNDIPPIWADKPLNGWEENKPQESTKPTSQESTTGILVGDKLDDDPGIHRLKKDVKMFKTMDDVMACALYLQDHYQEGGPCNDDGVSIQLAKDNPVRVLDAEHPEQGHPGFTEVRLVGNQANYFGSQEGFIPSSAIAPNWRNP